MFRVHGPCSKRHPVPGAQAHRSSVTDLNHRQPGKTATGRRGTRHDLAYSLIRVVRGEQFAACRQFLWTINPLQASFHLAQILCTGDDFLPGVAALVETQPPDLFEIEHLRHKSFLCRLRY